MTSVCSYAQTPDNVFDIYEVEARLAKSDIFALHHPSLNGGIKGTMYEENPDGDFFKSLIDIVVLDKETNTILYEIYLDQTSTNEYMGNSIEYYSPELGEGADFFPFTWNSNDVKSSVFGIDRFHAEYSDFYPYSFLQDSIDVIVEATVYNAELNSAKIPGLGTIGVGETTTSSTSLLGLWDWLFGKKKDCFDASMQDQCPCNIWNRMKNADKSKNSDLIYAAHRGLWGGELGNGAPENSKSAINAVNTDLTSVIEVDVMKTADNRLILSHDYIPNRLSEYTGSEYWFNKNYSNAISGYEFGIIGGMPHLYKLRKRNGEINNTKDYYLLFEDMIDIIKKKGLVVLIDIKGLIKKTGNPCINCDYDPATEYGKRNIKDSWEEIFKECYRIAVRKGALDYIAFKVSYPYQNLLYEEDFNENGLPEEKLKKVRFMPMIQPLGGTDTWDLNRALALIDSWKDNASKNVIAIETNFKASSDTYLKQFFRNGTSYENLLHYVVSNGFRPGIFSEEPVGPKGVVNRWGSWSMLDPHLDMRGDHLGMMSIPHFKTAVITTDRPDVWQQVTNSFNTPALRASFAGSAMNVTEIDNLEENGNTKVSARYESGSIIIQGLNKNDKGCNIFLVDLQGRLLHECKINTEPQMVIKKDLATGVYLLRLTGNRQTSIKMIAN